MWNNSMSIKTNTLEDTMYHKQTVVLHYKIEYPQFMSVMFQAAAHRINLYYRTNALAFELYCRTKLFKMAVEQYEYSVDNNYPVHEYEALQTYEITYQQDCVVSLYFDRYEYTGGAHGNTVRNSDTWNLQSGRRITLSQMFPPSVNYKTYLIQTITKQIEEQIKNGNDIYFENYEENVANSFNENSFYLTREGVVIYFQQYEIAPYASGIPQFLIPYSPKGPI
ncbi:DUF3298 and DUF4163 domain-containing protein [Oscillospiraceae bacterium PP1C4]